jgi:hypothetical protein
MSARTLCTALLRAASRQTAAAAIEGQQLLRYLPAALARSSHAFSTSAAPSDLAKVVQDELSHERSSYEKSEVVAGGPPAPFLLEQQPEDTLLTLRRQYKGEEIVVSVSDNLQVPLLPSGCCASWPLESDGRCVAMHSHGALQRPVDAPFPRCVCCHRCHRCHRCHPAPGCFPLLQDSFPQMEDEGEEYDTSAVSFNVSVAKGGRALVFECVSDGTTLDITHVSCEPAGALR